MKINLFFKKPFLFLFFLLFVVACREPATEERPSGEIPEGLPSQIAQRSSAPVQKKPSARSAAVSSIKKVFSKKRERSYILRKPKFKVPGAKYMLTLGVDLGPDKKHWGKTLRSHFLFDSEGTTLDYSTRKVPLDFRVFDWNGKEINSFRYKKTPNGLSLSVSGFDIFLPTRKALSRGVKLTAKSKMTWGEYGVKKGDPMEIRINTILGLPK